MMVIETSFEISPSAKIELQIIRTLYRTKIRQFTLNHTSNNTWQAELRIKGKKYGITIDEPWEGTPEIKEGSFFFFIHPYGSERFLKLECEFVDILNKIF